jgi:dedicator of cytokinesis protein 1
MWECALEVCEEIRQQHEETYNYSKLPKLHRQIADFYDRILDEPRFKAEYFRVAFYGGGFPSFLQDKVIKCNYSKKRQIVIQIITFRSLYTVVVL